MQTRAQKAIDTTVAVGEALAIVALVGITLAGFIAHYWTNEGRPVVVFHDPASAYVEAGRPGDQTFAHMPLTVTRQCMLRPDETFLGVRQNGEWSTLSAPYVQFGQPGVRQDGFRIAVAVPDHLQPGAADFTWRTVWDCGLRRVETVTPLARMEVLPPVR